MNGRKSFLLRMAPGLYEELEAWAQQELRSVNGQIEFILSQAVRRRRGNQESPSAVADSGNEPKGNSPPSAG